jgi:hypothetical protein
MGLVISKGLTLRKGWQPMDPDAAAYITAVETADGQALEEKTKIAIDNFVLGCKADGIWTAIKASCILAGARTLTGALVPLVGAAPTNFNFVSGDYNRETGLVGDGSTKYLNSNRNNNADPQNSKHMAAYATVAGTSGSPYVSNTSISAGRSFISNFVQATINRNVLSSVQLLIAPSFLGANRNSASSLDVRANKKTTFFTAVNSDTPTNTDIDIFRRVYAGDAYANARLAFYSIGESLDLALLDARVTDLINAFGAAIPS